MRRNPACIIKLRDPHCLGYVYGIHASQSLSSNVTHMHEGSFSLTTIVIRIIMLASRM